CCIASQTISRRPRTGDRVADLYSTGDIRKNLEAIDWSRQELIDAFFVLGKIPWSNHVCSTDAIAELEFVHERAREGGYEAGRDGFRNMEVLVAPGIW